MRQVSDIKCLKEASKPYSGAEKAGVQKILKANMNIVDVEIALTAEEDDNPSMNDSGKKGAQRIDFAALRKTTEGIYLQFYEAKHFSNKELRSEGKPKVIQQIEKYEDLLKEYEDEIRSSYFEVLI